MTDLEADTKFKKGDTVRENRSGSKPETVLSVNHPMIHTYEGKNYHHTKLVKDFDIPNH